MKFLVKSKNDLWTISGNFAFGPIKIWMLLVGQKVDYFLYYMPYMVRYLRMAISLSMGVTRLIFLYDFY